MLLLQAGYKQVCEALVHGSSTALIATVVGNLLRTVVLGDSALLVVRDGQVVHRTAETMHSWNFPFQLGMTSRDGPVRWNLRAPCCLGLERRSNFVLLQCLAFRTFRIRQRNSPSRC
jgi:hypothetical protein